MARSCLCAYHSIDPNPSATGRHPGNDRANERTDEDVEGGLLALSGVPVCLSVDRLRPNSKGARAPAPCASTWEEVQPGAASAFITRQGLFETLGRTGASPVRFARRSPALCAGERAERGCPGVNAQRTRPARQKMEIGGMARTKDNVHSAGARPMDIVISPQSRQGCGRAGGFPPGPILVNLIRDYNRKKDRA